MVLAWYLIASYNYIHLAYKSIISGIVPDKLAAIIIHY